jgi:beta-glucosidase/6-phospho-beta-glucosidase/beta-galactosidase
MSEMKREIKRISTVEMEELVDYVNEARRAQAAQDKFASFLRKQHSAPAEDGWNISADGFVREVEVAGETIDVPAPVTLTENGAGPVRAKAR